VHAILRVAFVPLLRSSFCFLLRSCVCLKIVNEHVCVSIIQSRAFRSHVQKTCIQVYVCTQKLQKLYHHNNTTTTNNNIHNNNNNISYHCSCVCIFSVIPFPFASFSWGSKTTFVFVTPERQHVYGGSRWQ